MIHFRYATHGRINQINCHPWRAGNCAVIHNGILPYTSSKRLSDTGHFVRDILQPLVRTGELFQQETIDAIADLIGSHNKLAILKPDGDCTLVNEFEGMWDNGIWYSNTGYKPVPRIALGYSRAILGDTWGATRRDSWRDCEWERLNAWEQWQADYETL